MQNKYAYDLLTLIDKTVKINKTRINFTDCYLQLDANRNIAPHTENPYLNNLLIQRPFTFCSF